MKTFEITYLWEGKERKATIAARDERWAKLLGPLQLMAGAEVLNVEEMQR